MDPRLQELLDHHEIRQLLATYCHGCDRADEVEMAGVYARGSWDDHGPQKMTGQDFALAVVDEAIRTTRLVSHLLGQSLIRVSGDTAGVETYFIATLAGAGADADGPEVLRQLGGRYVDSLVREDGHWRIATRLCVREWSDGAAVENDWAAGRGFIESARGPDDVSYAALGYAHGGAIWPALNPG